MSHLRIPKSRFHIYVLNPVAGLLFLPRDGRFSSSDCLQSVVIDVALVRSNLPASCSEPLITSLSRRLTTRRPLLCLSNASSSVPRRLSPTRHSTFLRQLFSSTRRVQLVSFPFSTSASCDRRLRTRSPPGLSFVCLRVLLVESTRQFPLLIVSRILPMDPLAAPIMRRTCLCPPVLSFLHAPCGYCRLPCWMAVPPMHGHPHLCFNSSQTLCSLTLSGCKPPRPSNPVSEKEFFNCFPRMSVYNDIAHPVSFIFWNPSAWMLSRTSRRTSCWAPRCSPYLRTDHSPLRSILTPVTSVRGPFREPPSNTKSRSYLCSVMSTIRFDLTFSALKCPFWEFKLQRFDSIRL